jgi:small ligand-binding sensory domain FIST
MRHAVGSSTLADTATATRQAIDQGLQALGGPPVTLACLFVTPHHAPDIESLVEAVLDGVTPQHLVGCSAENLIAGGREIADEPGVSLWLGRWPDAEIDSFHLEMEGPPDAPLFAGWPDTLPGGDAPSAFLLLADPFTTPIDALLAQLNAEHPGTPAFGGLASGGWTPGMNRMIVNDTIYDRGVSTVVVGRGVRVETLVSQGCRPIGRPFVITKADRNHMLQLSGKPALEQLKSMLAELSADEQALAQQALHVGQVVNERQGSFGRGDFLVRNVMGVDPESGAVAIGDIIRPGRTIQFHVRDAAAAHADLRQVLAERAAVGSLPEEAGVLFVSCNGRGRHLFGVPDQDSSAVTEAFGPVPSAGFFGAGEIGPVGNTNYLHGFTASLALFSPPA